MSQDTGTTLHQALDYVRRGWSIIPIESVGKRPVLRTWTRYQEQPPAEVTVRSWFSKEPALNIGILCGVASGGLVVRDFDEVGAYDTWKAEHPELAATLPTVETGRGHHVYFVAQVEKIKHFEDGELRGNGYCLAPPSIHPNGSRYRWLVPLPDGDLPLIDPYQVGLARFTERTETTEITEDHRREQKIIETTEAIVVSDELKNLDDLIENELPQQTGQRHRQVFEFARALKAVPHLVDAPVAELLPIVRKWHNLGVERGVISTQPFDETASDFVTCWPKIKTPKGAGNMTAVVERAKTNPLPEIARLFDSEPCRLLLAICRELQRDAGNGVFWLSCRTGAELTGISPTMVSKHLKYLAAQKVIEYVGKEKPGGKKAQRFRYIGD